MCKDNKEEYKTQVYPLKLKMTQTQIFEHFLKYVRRPKTDSFSGDNFPEAEFVEEIQTKVLRVFLLAIYSQLNSFALTVLFLHTHATSYSVVEFSYFTVHCKGERR